MLRTAPRWPSATLDRGSARRCEVRWRLELDTNTVERAIRPVALGRKNALFAGADAGGKHWAIVALLIHSAKLNDVDPLAWLTDVLERIVAGRAKNHELATLLPWNWKSAKPVEVPSSA